MQNRYLCRGLLSLIALFFYSYTSGQALTDDPSIINDHMFPAQAAAKPFIDYDSKGFLINGKRTFLVSAGIEYARVPQQLWYDRLLRLKRGGFNCVEIYTIWNFHEPAEGKFEFSGDHDLGLFLSLVKKLGMYAIVRIGPYYCAEWDQGGYPTWLRFKKGLRVREDNPEFRKYVDRFFDRLLPIVFRNQIHKGGSVILVQLENEHPKGWGTIMPDNYFRGLQSKALDLGMEVPYFFSGVHHASDPAGAHQMDDASRPNPWFSTEYWSVWYKQYGPKKGDEGLYDRRTWNIIANGGNGYNVYMAHGGSNFGYTNNDEDAASYDYGAAVGQAGDLRPLYYTFKRAASFAASFQDILENSSDGTAAYQYLLANTNAKQKTAITARTSPAGDLIFVVNPGTSAIRTMIKAAKGVPATSIRIDSGESYPLLHHFKLNESVTVDWALTRIYGLLKQQLCTTIVIEAETGEPVLLKFLLKNKPVLSAGQKAFSISGNSLLLQTQGRKGIQPAEYLFKAGKEQVRILVTSRVGTDETWFSHSPAQEAVITGVPYLAEISMKKNKISISAESPLQTAGLAKGTALQQPHIYLQTGSKVLNMVPLSAVGMQESSLKVNLSPWEYKDAALIAAPDYDDTDWLHGDAPMQMGADGDLSADAWYRSRFTVKESGKYSMQVEGGDRGTLFIDGKLSRKWDIRTGEVALDLEKGEHTMAVFTAHDGRDKLAAYLGPIDHVAMKGLAGTVRLRKGGPFYHTLNNWYFKKATRPAELKQGPPVLDTLSWKKYQIGADVFDLKEGYGWFAETIPAQPGLSSMTISFKSVDENATVFINGKEMIHHEGWNIPFELTVTDPAVLSRPMILTVFVENHDKEGGIDQPVKINTMGDGMIISGWKMRGGPNESKNTQRWKQEDDHGGGPKFYRSTFVLPEQKGKQLIWRFNPDGLGHGSVWINGHHIGRYPELNGDIGMYMPEPWLKSGNNEVIVYEEEGAKPAKASITSESAAGRNKYQLITE